MDDVYQYKFANGDVVSVPLSEEWTALLQELDRMEENNNQVERRRHCSLEWYNRYDNRLPQSHDAFEAVEERDAWAQMCECLTEEEAFIGDLYFRKGYRQWDLVIWLGISRSRIAQLLCTIQTKLQNAFYNH